MVGPPGIEPGSAGYEPGALTVELRALAGDYTIAPRALRRGAGTHGCVKGKGLP